MSEQLEELKTVLESSAQRYREADKKYRAAGEDQLSDHYYGKAVGMDEAIIIIKDMLEEQNDE